MELIYSLHAGEIVETEDGDLVEVMLPSEDGEWVLGRYIRASFIELYGQSELVHESEIARVIASSN